MGTKQISFRLLDMEDVERVAEELRTSKNKVVNASLHAHIHPDKPQNTAILKALERKEEKDSEYDCCFDCSGTDCSLQSCTTTFESTTAAYEAGECADCLTCAGWAPKLPEPKGAPKP